MTLPKKLETLKTPKLESKRLYMRAFTLNDAKICSKMNWKDEGKPIKTIEHAKNYLKKNILNKDDGYYLGVFLKQTNELVGDLEFCHLDWYNYYAGEICYGFHKNHRGKGYATEASSCLIDYIFRKVKMHKITADTDLDNYASQNVLRKLGFILEGTSREKNYNKEKKQFEDEFNWGLLKDEWLSKNKKPLYKIIK
jgi:RimJ/RimL family protein N-acetyltransferase